jgi:hypothetical protein
MGITGNIGIVGTTSATYVINGAELAVTAIFEPAPGEAPDTGNGGNGGTVVFEIEDFSGVTFHTSAAHFFADASIQLMDIGVSTWQIVGDALEIHNTSGTYKGIAIQTGTAAGGTQHWASSPPADTFFAAVTGKTYTIIVRASSPTAQARMRIQANNHWSESEDWELTNSPTDYEITWIQGTRADAAPVIGELNVTIDNHDAGPRDAIILIHSIKIYEID